MRKITTVKIENRDYDQTNRMNVTFVRRGSNTTAYEVKRSYHARKASQQRLFRLINNDKLVFFGIRSTEYPSGFVTLFTPTKPITSFPMLTVSREDIQGLGYDDSTLTDQDMAGIAWGAGEGESMMESYWDALRYELENRGVPQIKSRLCPECGNNGYEDSANAGLPCEYCDYAGPINKESDNA